MPRLSLPYPSSSLSETGRTGKLKFGFCETVVDVPECEPEAFRLAVTRMLNSETSVRCYENGGYFWQNAFNPFKEIGFDGIKSERDFPADTTPSKAWMRNIALDILANRLDTRAAAADTRIRRDHTERPALAAHLRPGDGHEADRLFFEKWAAENLLWSDGRLFKRIHSPSLFIGWAFQNFQLDNSVNPRRETSYWDTFGRHDFRPGLHYRLDDPAFFEKWAETQELFKTRAGDHASLPAMQYHSEARRILGKDADAPHIRIHDNLVIDMRALERITDEGWEDMVLRSANSIASAIASRSSPHLHHPGPLRTALETLKQLVAIPHEERGPDYDACLDDALAAIPEDGNWARHWYVNGVLERWTGREVALALDHAHTGIRPR